MRDSELAKLKELDANERKKVEQTYLSALEREAEEKRLKKLRMIEITSYDLKLKEEQKRALKESETSEAQKNFITKLFNRPTHQSYELREKQDRLMELIGDRFKSPDRNTASFEKKKAEDFEGQQQERVRLRKEKELEVKRFQDAQIDRIKNAKQAEKAKETQLGESIQLDANLYVAEQREKKQSELERRVKNQAEIKG